MPRLNIDWSKHELIIKKFKSDIDKECISYELKKPKTFINSIKFTNINGNLLVTGDFLSWIFCREFHPEKEFKVSDEYWIEKLTLANHFMEPKKYSSDNTANALLNLTLEKVFDNRGINIDEELSKKIMEQIKSDFCFPDEEDFLKILEDSNLNIKKDEKNEISKELEYYRSCYKASDDEYDYVEAMRNCPSTIEYEDYIFRSEISPSLKAVFDAFEEICRRV